MSITTKNSVERAKSIWKFCGSAEKDEIWEQLGTIIFCGQGSVRPGTYRWKVVGNSQKMGNGLVHGLGCELEDVGCRGLSKMRLTSQEKPSPNLAVTLIIHLFPQKKY